MKGYRADALERALSAELQNATGVSDVLREQMAYCLLGGGKRLRGGICLAFCELLGGGGAQDAMLFACALEMIHAYSLVHDDLPCMDNDAMRRGKPSAHKRFGEGNALLIGDALLTLAFSLCARAKSGTLGGKTVADAALHMVAGQFTETTQTVFNEAALRKVYAQKTGALFLAAATAGAHAAACTAEQAMIAQSYGKAFGFLFQLADDCADQAQDAKIGKQTLLRIVAPQTLQAEASSKAKVVLESLQAYEGEAAAWLCELIQETVATIQ